MSAETDLRDELERLSRSLDSLDSPDAATQLVRGQLELRRQELGAWLHALISKELRIRFVDTEEPQSSAISTSVVGALLTRLQTMLNYMRWALEAGPAVTGQVPGGIVRSAMTETVAFAPGSFQVLLRKSELELDDLFDYGIETLLDIAEYFNGGPEPDGLEERIADLGPEAVSRMQKLYKRLSEERLATSFHWRGRHEREVTVTPEAAGVLSMWLSDSIPDVLRETVMGVLKMADIETKRFALVVSGGRRIEGRSEADLAHVEIEATYRAEVVTTRYQSKRSGGTRERVTLLSLAKLD